MKKYFLVLLALIVALATTARADAPLIWGPPGLAKFLSSTGYQLNTGEQYIHISVDPSAGGGFVAPIGSLAVRNNAGAGELWLKTSAANTGWTLLPQVAGTGDVVGPASATDTAIALFNGTTGKIIKNSLATMDVSGNILTPGTFQAADITDTGLTASTVPYADASKKLTSSAVTTTELGYVSGVTSAIQTQLNGKLTSSTGWTTTGNAGTTPGTNFVGTTDAQALVLKTNGTQVANFTSGQKSVIGPVGATTTYTDTMHVLVPSTNNLNNAFVIQSNEADWTNAGTASTYGFSFAPHDAGGSTRMTVKGLSSQSYIYHFNAVDGTSNGYQSLGSPWGFQGGNTALVPFKVSGVTGQTADLMQFSSVNDFMNTVSSVGPGGQYRGPNGTVGAPGFAFNGDSNNGWFAPAADTQAWSESGAEVMRIDSTGLGIGATASTKLDVNGNARVRGMSTGVVHSDASGNLTSSAVDVSGADITGQLKAASFPALTGDLTTPGGSLTTTLANSGVSAGSYKTANITVDAKGRVTASANGVSSDVAYTPTTSANWNSVPTTVLGGLDTLASSGIVKSQAANTVMAAPNGSSGVMSPRLLVAADIPSLSATYLPLAGGTMSGQINMGSQKIISMADPTANQDAATKLYVDTQLAQLNPADAVYAASTANIAGTYVNAVSGICIGDTFTVTATGALSVDGASPPLGSRVLLKNQTSSFQDGVWTVTVVGSLGVSPVLTRALDFDSSADINAGQIIPIINGTVNAGASYFQTATVSTCNTDSQTWTQFQKASSAYASSTLTSAHLFVGNGSNVATDVALSNDCSLSNAGAITCTKTNSVSFATSATTDTTNAANISSGTLPAGRMPALTGDVTTSAGAVATTIAANAVTNAKAAQMAANTFKANNTGSTANATDITVAQANTLLGDVLASGTVAFTGHQSLGANAVTTTVANAGTTGTTVNKLAKLTGAPSTALIAATTDTGGIIGIVTSGAGTAGSAEIAREGEASCVFDGATTAGDYVSISSTTAGDCHDAGATIPTSGQIIGRVMSTNGSGGTYSVFLYPTEIQGASAGGGGTVGTVTSSAGTIVPQNFGTISNQVTYYQQLGKMLHVWGYFKDGTAASATCSLQLSGFTIDTTKVTTGVGIGWAEYLPTASTNYNSSNIQYRIFADSTDTAKVYITGQGGAVSTEHYQTTNCHTIFGNTEGVNLDFWIVVQ